MSNKSNRDVDSFCAVFASDLKQIELTEVREKEINEGDVPVKALLSRTVIAHSNEDG